MIAYDYIITGAGASGLLLAYRMAIDSFFDTKRILILDKVHKDQNDRTWCFWEEGKGEFDDIVSASWKLIRVNDHYRTQDIDMHPYQYKKINGLDFYDYVLTLLRAKENITIKKDEVISCTEEMSYAVVKTNTTSYTTHGICNSIIFDISYRKQNKYPVLQQHFIGWYIKTKAACFDPSKATFMDFDVPQQGNTQFIYFLPTSTTEALVEYTLFSKELLSSQEYEEAIVKYLHQKDIFDYQIIAKEQGRIPMTCYPFQQHSSKHIIHIGTAGGWTKPSTGYTFMNMIQKTKALGSFLKTSKALSIFDQRTRFWYYDLLFLDVLFYHNHLGSFLFSRLFQKNKIRRLFRFLDEESTFWEEFMIMWSMPKRLFLKTIWRRIRNA